MNKGVSIRRFKGMFPLVKTFTFHVSSENTCFNVFVFCEEKWRDTVCTHFHLYVFLVDKSENEKNSKKSVTNAESPQVSTTKQGACKIMLDLQPYFH